ncbi:acyl-CoA dehydrogenase family protein [Nonomuraea rubra]|uniref:acyl-CoA dehydrogenase family protein n=1 Tax=Nonomuraea rubra TaxID=46180 RepID=UPI00361AFEF6
MDFNLDETQQDLKKLAAEVLAKDGGEERLRQAGLMDVCVPEEAGGAGLGPVEMAVVLREAGARAAMVPALPTLAATLLLARHAPPAGSTTTPATAPATSLATSLAASPAASRSPSASPPAPSPTHPRPPPAPPPRARHRKAGGC